MSELHRLFPHHVAAAGETTDVTVTYVVGDKVETISRAVDVGLVQGQYVIRTLAGSLLTYPANSVELFIARR